MRMAIRELVAAGRRDELVIVLQSYSRFPWLLERMLAKGLSALGLDHADVLLLGWHNHMPSAGILERVARLQEKGMFRHLAVSSHKRPTFVGFATDPRFSILHVRYNAAHTGAERDVFPHLAKDGRPGIVAYTATRWGALVSPRKMPPGEKPLRGRDAYRFVLSNPDFNVCMTGPKNGAELREALAALDEGPLAPEEMARVRRIGEFVHGRAWRP
jgi:aryl-alcohol dehydrogenase-like predicted oxidoreductase